MINNELLIDGNIISQDELNKILSPFSPEELLKYAEQLSLTGLNKDITDYIQKYNSFLSTGDTESFNPNCRIVSETKTVKLYHRLIQDVDGKNVYENCTPDTDGAIAYDYTYTINKVELVSGNAEALKMFASKTDGYKQAMSDSLYCYIDDVKDNNLVGLYYADYNDFVKDFSVLEEIFLYNPFMTNRVILEVINDLLNNLDELKKWNKNNYNNEAYFNRSELQEKLGYLKMMYIAYYNAYEKACNFGFGGHKTTNGSELDEGI